jgi:hypothetical protein
MTRKPPPILTLFRELVAARRGAIHAGRAWHQADMDGSDHLSDLARELWAAKRLEADALARLAARMAELKISIFVDGDRGRGAYMDVHGRVTLGTALVAGEDSL